MRKYPVIDTHYHLGTSAGGCNSEESLLKWMDDNELDYQIIMQVNEGTTHHTPQWNPCLGNDFISNMQKKYPDKIIGIGTVLPWYQPPLIYSAGEKYGQPFQKMGGNPAVEEAERIVKDLGLYGLKLHPLEHGYQINDPHIMFPIYEKLTEMQEKTGRKLIMFVHAAGDDIGNTPEGIADAASHFKDLMFIVSHCGYARAVPTLASMLADKENVMLDLTTVAIPALLKEAYKAFGASRFTAGADGPFATCRVKNAIVECLTEDKEERELILGGNIMRYLNIPWDGSRR